MLRASELFLVPRSSHLRVMDDSSLLRRADLNYIEFNRESARSTAGGIVQEEDGRIVGGNTFVLRALKT